MIARAQFDFSDGRPSQNRLSRRHTQRRGLALVTAIVALIVSATIVLGILRSATRQFLEIRDQQHYLQADELLDAGIGRAMAELRKSSDYTGETWRVGADELGGSRTARVEIKVKSNDSDPGQRTLIVQANYPPDEFNRVRITREIIISIPSAGTTP